jgi:ketosteroid isomerase-like protein
MNENRFMGAQENVELVRRFYAAGPSDDDEGRAEFATPDIVWHVPGDNPVSGRYQGYEEVFSTIAARMRPLHRWEVDVREVMGNDDMVVAVVDLTAVREDHHVESRGSHLFRFADDGRIAEVWGFVNDQAGLDTLFAS